MESVDGLSTEKVAGRGDLAGESVDVTPNDVPEGWDELLVAARFVDRRNGRPSMRQLAAAAHTHASTISALMYGSRETKTPVVEKVIEAISRESGMGERRVRQKVFELMHRALADGGRFEPHEDANLLSREEQAAVNELIRLLALSKKQGGGAHARGAAPIDGGDDGAGGATVTELHPKGPQSDDDSAAEDDDVAAYDPDPDEPSPGDPDDPHPT